MPREHEALRDYYQFCDENPWIRGARRLDCTVHSARGGPAAPAARSWVGWVRVVGAADVIDALDAWQKRPFRRIPSPGQHRSGSFGSRSELFPGVVPPSPLPGMQRRLAISGHVATVVAVWTTRGSESLRERPLRAWPAVAPRWNRLEDVDTTTGVVG